MSFEPICEADVTEWSGTADVVVVGFGGAGACAAIEAVDCGASVTMFEAASASGLYGAVISRNLSGWRHPDPTSCRLRGFG